MVAYSFQARFRQPILAGTKTQTIRAPRKRHAAVGEEMQLYTGMRTKYCSIIAKTTCRSTQVIEIHIERDRIILHSGISVGQEPIVGRALDTFAERDGFETWADMKAFWLQNHPGVVIFTGVCIAWHPIGISAAEII